MIFPPVCQALVLNLSPEKLSVKYDFFCTPQMTLLSEGVASEDSIWQRFDCLVG